MMQTNPLPVETPVMVPTKSPLSVKSFLPASIVLVLLGWGGLAAVIYLTTPSGGTRWLFFFTAVLGLTGIFLPVMAFLNRRFPPASLPTPGVILRQALFVGVYLPTLAWLQLGLVLTPSLAVLLAFGLILVESLLQMRERSQWSPESKP
jgi:hypothetical protein